MKKIILATLFVTFSMIGFSQFQLSSHILDISAGLPASNVNIKLEQYDQKKDKWTFVAEKITDENGRIKDFLPESKSNIGIYRFTYYTETYFAKKGIESFYPFIEVVFEIKDDKHYHVPITLSAFGYSTYRGN